MTKRIEMKCWLLMPALLLIAGPACGQAEEATAVGTLTETEQRVQEIVAQDGVHVVHFWAPWCHNSNAEFRKGWYAVIDEETEVTFTFVTVFNDGETGAATLKKYNIPERVTVLAQPDHGPSDDKSQRRRSFLGLPLTWTPTTWIYLDGKLAYAHNYGELEMETLRRRLADARADWSH